MKLSPNPQAHNSTQVVTIIFNLPARNDARPAMQYLLRIVLKAATAADFLEAGAITYYRVICIHLGKPIS